MLAYEIGSKHNQLLEYIENGMTDEDTASLQSIHEAEKRLIKNYFSEYPVCGYDSNMINSMVNKTNDFYIEVKNANQGVFSLSTAVNRMVDTVLSKLTILQGIDQDILISEEVEFIKEILDSIKSVQTDQRFSADEELVRDFDTKWETFEFDTCNNQGYMFRIMIRVMDNSYNFWVNYPHDINERTVALPVWAGLDILGALSGGLRAMISNLWHNQPVNWGNVGSQALLFAAAGSTVEARWFTKIFK